MKTTSAALCVFVSGAAGLIYQTVWLRQFSTVFGTSEIAVATVLACYMAGLALGSAVAGRFSVSVDHPMRVLGAVEVLVGIGAIASLAINPALSWFLSSGSPDIGPATTWDTAVRSSVAILGIGFPCFWMAFVLPLVVRIYERPGLFYGLNTAGGVAGLLFAAFYALPEWGMSRSIWCGVACNLIACALARGADVRQWRLFLDPYTSRYTSRRTPRDHLITGLMAVCGFVAFTLEITWFRLVSHSIGGSVQAFAAMLSATLAGLSVGSIVGQWCRFRSGFPVASVLFAGSILIAFAGMDASAEWLSVGTVWERTAKSWVFLFPPSMFSGMLFPVAVDVLRTTESRSVARVVAANTAGCIFGALCGGLWILPTVGFAGVIAFTASTMAGVAIVSALSREPHRASVAAALIATAIIPASFLSREPARLLTLSALGGGYPGQSVYTGVGRSSTVRVSKRGENYLLTCNGMPESIITTGQPARMTDPHFQQWLLVDLPAALRPSAESMLVIGFGGGSALEVVPDTIQAVDVIELEPKVVEASRAIRSARNIDPLEDPRIRVVYNDARAALQQTRKQWDVVVSQPSHHWTAGASHLFTEEFFRIVRKRVKPGGVFVQWTHTWYGDGATVRLLASTLLSAFPRVAVYEFQGTAYLVASDQRLGPVDFTNTFGLWDCDETRERVRGVGVNTDDWNQLAFSPPQIHGMARRDFPQSRPKCCPPSIKSDSLQ